jgi:hypothetical protein
MNEKTDKYSRWNNINLFREAIEFHQTLQTAFYTATSARALVLAGFWKTKSKGGSAVG